MYIPCEASSVGDPIMKKWRVRIPLVGLNPPYYSDGHNPGL
jgi:hypothetical protein